MLVWNTYWLFKKRVTKPFCWLFFSAFTIWSPSSYKGLNSSFRKIEGGSFLVPYWLRLLLPFPLWLNQVLQVVGLFPWKKWFFIVFLKNIKISFSIVKLSMYHGKFLVYTYCFFLISNVTFRSVIFLFIYLKKLVLYNRFIYLTPYEAKMWHKVSLILDAAQKANLRWVGAKIVYIL